jgi:hypothetical protein
MRGEPYASAKTVFWNVDNASSHAGQRSIDRLQDAYPNARVSTCRCTPRGSGESPGGVSPPALAEPSVNLSAHRAPITQPVSARPSCQ